MERRTALALVCALALVGCGGGNSKPAPSGPNAGLQFAVSSATEGNGGVAYKPTGRIVVDNGFRAEANGFNFQNYGPGFQDLAPPDVADLFGPRVCASGAGRDCQLTPPAEQWMTTANQSMAGGHCYGFSVTALMMYQHLLNPLDYGAPNPPALALFGNVALQERIAESFALQTSQRVLDGQVKGTPNQVLDALIAALRNPKETYTVGIFSRDHSVGHAVTPYAVEDKGGGRFAVLIYDNNFPQITRGIIFDRNHDSWSYEAARNPAEASQLLDGDATTQTISLLPTTPGIGVQPCPFCDSAQAQQISLNGDTVNHAHLTMTDGAGRKTGYVDGKLVNQIPGARVLPLYLVQNWREHPEPIYRIPQGVPVTVTIDGSGLAAPDAESVSVIGPGYSAVAGNLTVRPGQRDEMRVTAAGGRVLYRTGAGHTQRPHLVIGVGRGGRNYSFTVAPPPIPAGSAMTAVAQPARQRLAVATSGPQSGGSYSLAVTQIRRSGAKAARGRAVKVRSGGSAQVALGRTR